MWIFLGPVLGDRTTRSVDLALATALSAPVLLVLLLLGFAGSPASHFRRQLWPAPSRRETA